MAVPSSSDSGSDLGLGGKGSAAKFKSRSSPHWECRPLSLSGQQTVPRKALRFLTAIAHVQPDTSVYNYLYIRHQSLRPYLYFSSIGHSMLEVVSSNVLPSITAREYRTRSAGPP